MSHNGVAVKEYSQHLFKESQRRKFEQFMSVEMLFNPETELQWDSRRNCYVDFRIHLAWSAWFTASKQTHQRLPDVLLR